MRCPHRIRTRKETRRTGHNACENRAYKKKTQPERLGFQSGETIAALQSTSCNYFLEEYSLMSEAPMISRWI